MTGNGWAQILSFFLAILAVTKPLGWISTPASGVPNKGRQVEAFEGYRASRAAWNFTGWT